MTLHVPCWPQLMMNKTFVLLLCVVMACTLFEYLISYCVNKYLSYLFSQRELVRRHIQKEFWRVQDVLEGLHKNNSSRGTDTGKNRGNTLLENNHMYSGNTLCVYVPMNQFLPPSPLSVSLAQWPMVHQAPLAPIVQPVP